MNIPTYRKAQKDIKGKPLILLEGNTAYYFKDKKDNLYHPKDLADILNRLLVNTTSKHTGYIGDDTKIYRQLSGTQRSLYDIKNVIKSYLPELTGGQIQVLTKQVIKEMGIGRNFCSTVKRLVYTNYSNTDRYEQIAKILGSKNLKVTKTYNNVIG